MTQRTTLAETSTGTVSTLNLPAPATRLTRIEVETLREIMQSHLDKAITYGNQVGIQINKGLDRANVITEELLPKLAVHLNYAQGQPIAEETAAQLGAHAETMAELGAALVAASQEYRKLHFAITDFLDSLPE